MTEKKYQYEEEVAEFLGGLNYWLKRIRYDTKFWFSFIIIFAIWWISGRFLYGIDTYLQEAGYLLGALVLIITIGIVFFAPKYLKNFINMIIVDKEIFLSEKEYTDFMALMKKSLTFKGEYFISLIGALLYAGLVFYSPYVINNTSFEGILRYIFILFMVTGALTNGITALLGFSTIIVIISIFRCINKLGTSEFSLNINYKELKMGAFNNIGKFIMEVSIPVIIISAYLSILGLVWIYLFDNYLYGLSTIIVGFLIILLIAFLSYKNTIHIHERIVEFKAKEKRRLMDHVQQLISKPNPEEIDYDKVYKIEVLYKQIEKIYTWPYDPKTVKKLFITLGSSVLPLILSFFGLV